MKLYTEEQVKKMIEKSQYTGLTADFLILAAPSVQLPTDEEIDREIEWLDNPLERLNFKAGIRWMRDKIRIQGR
jgi:hypothetical protein